MFRVIRLYKGVKVTHTESPSSVTLTAGVVGDWFIGEIKVSTGSSLTIPKANLPVRVPFEAVISGKVERYTQWVELGS